MISVFFFNCIHGKVNCNFLNFINLVDTSSDRRSAQKGIPLKIPRVKTTIFFNSYFNRIGKTWNVLPDSIRVSSNINIFKRKINEFYFNKLITYNVNNQCSWSAACGCSKHHSLFICIIHIFSEMGYFPGIDT